MSSTRDESEKQLRANKQQADALCAQAKTFYDAKEYEKAIPRFDRAIELGHAEAMTHRAVMHTLGQGCSIDYDRAIELYNLAIALHNVSARNNLAGLLSSCPDERLLDFQQAIELFRSVIASNSNPRAAACSAYSLAGMHEKGLDLPVNLEEAYRLYQLAGNINNARNKAAQMKSEINRIAKNNKKRDALRQAITTQHEKMNALYNNMITVAKKPMELPDTVIQHRQEEERLLQLNGELLGLLDSDNDKQKQQASKLLTLNNLLLNHPDALTMLRTDPQLTHCLSASTDMPANVKLIADTLKTCLDQARIRMQYIIDVRDALVRLKNELNDTNHQWKVKSWRNEWVDGEPYHIKTMKSILAAMNETDFGSIAQTQKAIIHLLLSIKDRPDRHDTTKQFYQDCKLPLMCITMNTQITSPLIAPPVETQASAVIPAPTDPITEQETPPPSYAESIAANPAAAAAAVDLHPAPAYQLLDPAPEGFYPQIIHNGVLINPLSPPYTPAPGVLFTHGFFSASAPRPDARSAAAIEPKVEQDATSGSSQSRTYDTQAFIRLFPPAPTAKLPPVPAHRQPAHEERQPQQAGAQAYC